MLELIMLNSELDIRVRYVGTTFQMTLKTSHSFFNFKYGLKLHLLQIQEPSMHDLVFACLLVSIVHLNIFISCFLLYVCFLNLVPCTIIFVTFEFVVS